MGETNLCEIDRILELLKQQNKTQKDLTDYLGVSKNLFTEWKAGRNHSYWKYLKEIADYLDCSIDFLVGRTDIPDVNRG